MNTVESYLKDGIKPCLLSNIIPDYLRHCQHESLFSPQTIHKYGECLQWIIRDLGDLDVREISVAHTTLLKEKIRQRGAGESRVASMISTLKSLLRYCNNILEIQTVSPSKLVLPKRRNREVVFLTNEEVNQFLESIKLDNCAALVARGNPLNLPGLRFRALVEVLLGTGMRISEALSITSSGIDFVKREAKIIGKGNKERTVFFTPRCLQWVRYYLEQRKHENDFIFLTNRGSRMQRADVAGLFARYTKQSGLNKVITPRILRHTTATNLLFNGCPIGHIKEILGHEKLETTCKYYLGVDKRLAKEAHSSYLRY